MSHAPALRQSRTPAPAARAGGIDLARIRNDLLALGLLAGAVFLALSLASFDPTDPPSSLVYPARREVRNWCGPNGAQAAHMLMTSFGYGAYFVLAVLVVADVRLFSRTRSTDPFVALIGATMTVVAVCAAGQLILPSLSPGALAGCGGVVGQIATALLREFVTLTGALILCGAVFLAGLLLAGEISLLTGLARVTLLPITMWFRAGARRPTPPARPAAGPLPQPVPVSEQSNSDTPADVVELTHNEPTAPPVAAPILPVAEKKKPVRSPKVKAPEPTVSPEPEDDCGEEDGFAALEAPAPVEPRHIKVNPPVQVQPTAVAAPVPRTVPETLQPFVLPSVDILEEAEDFPYEELAQRAQVAAATLEKTFQQFGLNVKVVEVDTGPVITQYELELEAGLRLSKVSALADDLAIALRVPSVRVVAPIPGKNTVGVEVPNDVRVMVRLKELIQSSPKDLTDKRIPLYLGKDVSGKPTIVDMCKMPHLLIAGRTGTGKSVCLNSLILSILMTRSPEQVKMLMIDPKMVELSPYSRIPHLMHPVITDMKKAEAVLGWAVDKMEERYDLLARVGVRHLDNYNKLGKETILKKLGIDPDSEEAEAVPETMPYIVIIADEMADMIMTSGKDVEGYIIRLAQKSRAVGIHLVLATQKPTVDVITGLIKSNLPARISFQVASRMDSRVVLDEMGAEKLLGNGDMLYLAPGTSNLTRAQGTYVSDDEVNQVIEYFADMPAEYDPELIRLKAVSKGDGKGSGSGGGSGHERDDLYDAAVDVVLREGRGSVSLLQRALGVGYGRGARLIDYMAEDGVVGTYNGSQAREVIMSFEEWEALKAAR